MEQLFLNYIIQETDCVCTGKTTATVKHMMNHNTSIQAGEILSYSHIPSIYSHVESYLFWLHWEQYWLDYAVTVVMNIGRMK